MNFGNEAGVVFQFISFNLCEAGRCFVVCCQNSRRCTGGFHFIMSESQGADTDLEYDTSLPKQKFNPAYFHLTSLNSNENFHTAG